MSFAADKIAIIQTITSEFLDFSFFHRMNLMNELTLIQSFHSIVFIDQTLSIVVLKRTPE